MDHHKAKLILNFFLFFMIIGCGELQTPEMPPGEGGANQQSPNWILGTWAGTQKAQRSGQNVSAASVQMKFFANQVFHLSFPEQSSNFVQGKYIVNTNNTLLLKVEQSSAKLYAPRPIPESFRYNFKSPQLQIYNQQVQLDLKISENPDESTDNTTNNAALFSLFDNWTCFDDQFLWKINILPDKSYYLRRYAANNRLPEERAGNLNQYKETPAEAVEKKMAHISFYLDNRKQNLIFTIIQASRSLKVEYFQGSIKPALAEKISCFR